MYLVERRCWQKNLLVVRSESVRNIIRERRMLEHLNHPFLCNLRYSFQDIEYMCVLSEVVSGGKPCWWIAVTSLSILWMAVIYVSTSRENALPKKLCGFGWQSWAVHWDIFTRKASFTVTSNRTMFYSIRKDTFIWQILYVWKIRAPRKTSLTDSYRMSPLTISLENRWRASREHWHT